MKLRTSCSAALLCATLLGCGGADEAPPREWPLSRVQAWWSIQDLKQSYAIRSEADWQRVWQLHRPQTLPEIERPRVDFSRDMVLGLSLGWGPSGCHSISIRRVLEEQHELRVEYLSEPALSTRPGVLVCTTALVPLTDFVVVMRSDKSVYFVQVDN
jgi:hypothetical protein